MGQNSESYAARICNELAHYSALLASQTTANEAQSVEPRVPAFEFAMQRYSAYVRSKMPHIHLESYVVECAKRSDRPVRILSLGAGTGDWELAIARAISERVEFVLVDLNAELLKGTCSAAQAEGITLEARVEDVNRITIAPRHYDLIVCRSSLHHFVELEHILTQIKQGLSPEGQLRAIGEGIGRNGLMLYPETARVAQAIFSSLPPRLRFNHYTKQIDDVVPNYDHSHGSFEAIRSEDILPLLMSIFTPVEYIVFDAFVSLLLDWQYGPNYDLGQEMDRSLVSLITEMDIQLITHEILRPTALFGIFK